MKLRRKEGIYIKCVDHKSSSWKKEWNFNFFEKLPLSSIYFHNFLSCAIMIWFNFEEMNIMLSISLLNCFLCGSNVALRNNDLLLIGKVASWGAEQIFSTWWTLIYRCEELWVDWKAEQYRSSIWFWTLGDHWSYEAFFSILLRLNWKPAVRTKFDVDYDIFLVYILTIFCLVYISLLLINYFGKYTFVCVWCFFLPQSFQIQLSI